MMAGVPLDIELILPIQFARSTDTSPEKRLMAAVLKETLHDLVIRRTHDGGRPIPEYWGLGTGSRRRGPGSLVTTPREYFLSAEKKWPYSFENLCDALGLHADTIRQTLRGKGLL